jgi:lambda family phage portal protein
MLRAAEFSEVVAYRIAASKMGIWERDKDSQNADVTGVADEEETNEDGEKELIERMEPGKYGFAPDGYHLKETNPTHPNGNIPNFNTMILQGVSSGIGLSYHGLTGDLTKVNYSSARVGMLSERELWKTTQNHFIKFFVKRIFVEFLNVALLTELKDVPFRTDYADYANYTGRRWTWVDPEKEVNAQILAITNGLSTYSDVLAEQGKDFDENMEQLKKELDAIAALGLKFPLTSTSSTEPEEPKDSNEPGEEDPEKPKEEPDAE